MDFSQRPPQAKTLEEAQSIIDMLWKLCGEMQKQIIHLENRVKSLEAQLNQNSQNSSKPPSSDGLKKFPVKNLRGKSGKSRGGQPGHQRHILEKHLSPDKVIYHTLDTCVNCHHSLKAIEATDYEARQVFDIPPLKIEVTEHRGEQKTCPHCCQKSTAQFPRGIEQETQYGTRLKGLCVYLNQYQFLPYARLQEFFKDMFGHKISLGMLVKVNEQCSENIKEPEIQIKQQLQNSPYLHHDESGIRVEGKLHWCHVASTPTLTSYGIYAKRGKESIETMSIVEKFSGRLIHDFFKPYFSYECKHGLCNAHHLRELKFIEEEHGQEWAKHMANLLLAIKGQVDDHLMHQWSSFSPMRIKAYERCYDEIVMLGLWHPDNIPERSSEHEHRKHRKQTKAKNLLDRLRFHKDEVLAFMYDFTIPFTNNQAEQDIRMLKVKQKISGCFRSQNGAQWFARIRSYISTAKKQGQNILQVLQNAFDGCPFLPLTP